MAIYMAQRLAAGMAVPETVMVQPSKSQQEARLLLFGNFATTTVLRISAIKTEAPPKARWSRLATASYTARPPLADLISMELSSKCRVRLIRWTQLQLFA